MHWVVFLGYPSNYLRITLNIDDKMDIDIGDIRKLKPYNILYSALEKYIVC